MTEAPLREEIHVHQCPCLVLRPHPSGRMLKDRCHEPVHSPDVPFCRNCEDRHPEEEKNDGVIVTTIGIMKGQHSEVE